MFGEESTINKSINVTMWGILIRICCHVWSLKCVQFMSQTQSQTCHLGRWLFLLLPIYGESLGICLGESLLSCTTLEHCRIQAMHEGDPSFFASVWKALLGLKCAGVMVGDAYFAPFYEQETQKNVVYTYIYICIDRYICIYAYVCSNVLKKSSSAV